MFKMLLIFSILFFTSQAIGMPIALMMSSYDEQTFEPIPVLRNGEVLPIGSLIQIIRDGGNTLIDPPDSTGLPGGDDILNSYYAIGVGTDTAGTFSLMVTAFSLQSERINNQTIYAGDYFYIRIWCGAQTTVPVMSTPVPEHSLWAVSFQYFCPSSDRDFWNVHMAPSSQNPLWTEIVYTSTREPNTLYPSSFELSASPNPFNATTTLHFSLPKTGVVTMDILNTLGQPVFSYPKRNYLAGNHSVLWNATEMPSGIYYLRCTTHSGAHFEKLVLLK